MAVKFKTLASGRLGETGATGNPCPTNQFYGLYSVPQGKSAIVVAMRFVNTHTSPVPMSMTLNHANDPVPMPLVSPIFPANTIIGVGGMLLEDEELTLEAGDTLCAKVGKDGDASNATYADKIDFVISGIEMDI